MELQRVVEMTHVCMVAYTKYPTDSRVRREAKAVASIPNHVVTVLTLKEKTKPRIYRMDGVVVQELNIAKYRGNKGRKYILSYLYFTFLAFFACTKKLVNKTIDVLHAHNMPNFIVLAGLAPYLSGKPIVLDVHDTMIETYAAKFNGRSSKLLNWVLNLEEAICTRMARHIICVNDIQKAALVKRNVPEKKITVSMNVPDPEVFDHTRSIQLRSDAAGKFRMIYHGTVAKRINIDLAIRAVSKLKDRIPALELHVVGDGDDLPEFKALSRELGIENKIHFERAVPLEGLIQILEKMDIGIVPNGRNIATELMLPVKMLECVALGIPVIAPRLKAITHYFTEDMVFFFDPDDVDSLADAIQEAYSRGASRLEKAREARRFLEKYGWESHKRDFMEMYQNLMKRMPNSTTASWKGTGHA